MNLNNAHVLLTGGSKGIGIAIARELARHHVRLTIVARPSPELDKIVAEVGAFAITADLSDPSQVENLVARAEAVNGPLDVLINNAALKWGGGLAVPASELQAQLTANLLSPMELLRQAVPGMIERKRGAIVTVSSLAGVFPQAKIPGYSPAKAGMAKYTFDMQRELKKYGIGVTLVYLGMISGTQKTDPSKVDPVVAKMGQKFNKMPKVTTEDVAAKLVNTLLSDRQMNVITMPGIFRPLIWLHELPMRLIDPLFKEAFE